MSATGQLDTFELKVAILTFAGQRPVELQQIIDKFRGQESIREALQSLIRDHQEGLFPHLKIFHRQEVFFKDVLLGERFEFTMQLVAAAAIKARFGTIKFPEVDRTCQSNLVIVEILPHMRNVANRKPGDYEWLPDEGIVIVERPLTATF